jgi:hypothetical protein
MVGTRRNLLSKHSSYTNGNGTDNVVNGRHREDLESGYGSINPIKTQHRFHDAIKQTIYSNRASEMKKKLIDNVDHQMLEHFRKSDTSVSTIQEFQQFSMIAYIPIHSSNVYRIKSCARFTKSRTVGSTTG